MIHLDHEDDEVTLQVLGLLKHLTSKANKKAQDCVQKKISSEESLFSKRVYKLLENAIAVFNHPVLRSVLVCNVMNSVVIIIIHVYMLIYIYSFVFLKTLQFSGLHIVIDN